MDCKSFLKFLPHTQIPPSCLHQVEQEKGPSLRSNPGPLYEESDSCQGRREGDEKPERGGELNVSKTLLLISAHNIQNVTVTAVWRLCLSWNQENKGFSRAFTAAGVCDESSGPC